MKKRSVNRIVRSQDIQMDTLELKQALPIGSIEQVDPFLLLHHIGPKIVAPEDRNAMEVGAHPHRGFEPVTFIFSSEIHHRDSRGNESTIGAGGVQWMTAGMGIVHSENLSKSFLAQGGKMEFIQLWINLPARLKMVQPKYQGFQSEAIPVFSDQDDKVKVHVISGTYKNLKGPVDSLTGITAFTVVLKTGAKVEFQEKAERNILLYQVNGIASVNGISTGDTKMVTFKNDGESIEIEAQTDGRLLFLSGDPISEKVTRYGPYVMNSQTEVMEAMRDYQMGKMGILI